jgi:hypothetical protein
MSDTSINQFNLKIRTSPWYQEWFASKGLDPNKVQLDKKQREELKGLVEQQTGFKFPGDMKIDPAGNLNEKGGWAGLPTGVKIALIAAAAVGTAGAAGAVGGPAAVANAVPGVSGSLAPVLPATPAALAGGSGALAGIGGATGAGLSTMDRIGSLIKPAAGAVAGATEAAAQRQALGAQQQLQANAQDISGEANFQSQQQSMAELEAKQQELARKNLYRASVAKSPSVSPENRAGAPTFSPEMLEGLTNLEKQALLRTAEEPQYTTSKMRKPRDYQPLDVEAMSKPSTMQTIGNWLAPGLSLADIGRQVF